MAFLEQDESSGPPSSGQNPLAAAQNPLAEAPEAGAPAAEQTLSQGASGNVTQASPTATNQPAAQRKTPNQGFTNIKNFIQANSSYNQGKGLAGKVADDVGGKVKAVDQAVKSGAEQTAQVQNAAGQQARTALAGAQPSVDMLGQGAAGDRTAAVDSIKKAQAAEFNGPMGLVDAANLARKAQETKALGSTLTSGDAGVKAGLKQLYSKPTYSAGQQKLDSLLINTGSKESLQDLRKQVVAGNQLDRQVNEADMAAKGNASAFSSEINAGKTALGQKITDALGSRVGDVTKKVADFNANREAQTARIDDTELAAAAQGAGYEVRQDPFGKRYVTIPGTGVKISTDQFRNMITGQSEEATLSNFDQGAVDDINALRGLGGKNDSVASDLSYQGLDRGISNNLDATSINNALSELAGAGVSDPAALKSNMAYSSAKDDIALLNNIATHGNDWKAAVKQGKQVDQAKAYMTPQESTQFDDINKQLGSLAGISSKSEMMRNREMTLRAQLDGLLNNVIGKAKAELPVAQARANRQAILNKYGFKG